MRQSTARRAGFWAMHYGALALYLAVALFPLFWLFKVSMTPNDLLYTEGVRMWPSHANFDHYASVIRHTDFPLFFRNSVLVSTLTAFFTTLVAAGAGYSFSRFVYGGKFWIVGLMLMTQMFPLVMIIAPIYKLFTLPIFQYFLGPQGLTNSITGLVLIYTTYNVPFAASSKSLGMPSKKDCMRKAAKGTL